MGGHNQLQDYNLENFKGTRDEEFYLTAIQVFLRMAAIHNGNGLVTVVWDGSSYKVPVDYSPEDMADSWA